MDRTKIDIKDCDNIGEPFSFENAIRTYRYLKENHCRKWEINIKLKTDDFWRYTGNDISRIFQNRLENKSLLIQAFGREKDVHLLRIDIASPISLEKVITIWEELITSLEYEPKGIEYDPKEEKVTSNLVKK